MKNPIPTEFRLMLHDLMGHEADALLSALEEEPVTSIRINRRKPVIEFEVTDPVPWCNSGYYLPSRPEFIFDPLLHVGTYYVQDASSMIYETVIEKILPLFIYDKLKVLDLCAAPGGKTTAMINALPDGTIITANEYSSKRVGALKENLERWGYPDVKVTNRDTKFYGEQGEQFDIIAVDAPCSGEGMMRKEEVARTQWSQELVTRCAGLQREILTNAYKALKPGGVLIYSTCTFNRCENEDNAEWLVKEFGLKPIDPTFPEDWGISRGINTELPVYRFMPHKTRGEGLFLAVFRKSQILHKEFGDDDLGEKGFPPLKSQKNLSRHPIYQPTGKQVPETHEIIELDKATAIKYLQGEALILSPDVPKGILTVAYRGFPLGHVKNIGSRANNLYPKQKRILKR